MSGGCVPARPRSTAAATPPSGPRSTRCCARRASSATRSTPWGDLVFSHLEVPSYAALVERFNGDPVAQRWEAEMADVLEYPNADPQTGWPERLVGGLVAVRYAGLDHVGFTVTDLDRSAAWYTELLGEPPVLRKRWEQAYVARVLGYPEVVLDAAFWRLPGGTVLELLEYVRAGRGHRRHGDVQRRQRAPLPGDRGRPRRLRAAARHRGVPRSGADADPVGALRRRLGVLPARPGRHLRSRSCRPRPAAPSSTRVAGDARRPRRSGAARGGSARRHLHLHRLARAERAPGHRRGARAGAWPRRCTSSATSRTCWRAGCAPGPRAPSASWCATSAAPTSPRSCRAPRWRCARAGTPCC